MNTQTPLALDGPVTVEQIAETSARVSKQRDPEFVRLPKTGTLCPYTGLTRSRMNELILPCPSNGFKAPVKSVVLRQRGKVKGVRLIDYASLIAFIRAQADIQGEG